MSNPHGYTKTDLVIAFAIILVATVIIVFIANPARRLAERNDVVREDGVRDIMEVMLEMFYDDSTTFAAMIEPTAYDRVMIGTGEGCAGDFGLLCGDEAISDDCFNLSTSAIPDYISELPVDPNDEIYSVEASGYYLEFVDGALYVGACNPEARDEVILWNKF
ncbi:MAG: hypothetical protein Q8P30_04865 [Candidatus Uhrbacteria bacterium]|nr:hypothetical protein [Candidatus Uhrbacteria bacterium]